MKNINLSILFFFLLLFNQSVAQGNLYLINENRVSKLILDKNNIIPIPKNGASYRILQVNLKSNQKLISFFGGSNKNKIELFHLPIIKTISNENALDVILPVTKNYSLTKGNQYFLLKISGNQSGLDNFMLKINLTDNTISKNLSLAVSNSSFSTTKLMNVWSYFDYNFLVKDLKSSVIKDLKSHKVSSIVIPPYVLPEVNNITNGKLIQLSSYLNGATGFDNYLIYYGGFKNNKNVFLTPKWKQNYKSWLGQIVRVFNNKNISTSKLYLYPFDEPKGSNVSQLRDLVKFTKTIIPDIKFFGTVSDLEAISTIQSLDIVQVHSDVPGLMESAIKSNSKNAKIWLYETRFPNAASNSPQRYLNLAYKMKKYNINGYGVWSYADSKNDNSKEINNGKASWEMRWVNNSNNFNNSLIYRKGNQIYSSLRWEALFSGNFESFWLDQVQKKYGLSKSINYASKLSNGNLDVNSWEKFKLNLIN